MANLPSCTFPRSRPWHEYYGELRSFPPAVRFASLVRSTGYNAEGHASHRDERNQATMMPTETTARDRREIPEIAEHVRAALVAVRGQLLLLVGGEARWRRDPGCVFIPLELPGAAVRAAGSPESAPEATLAAIGSRWLGRPLRLVPADITYGPTPAHAIDRLPPHGAPAPLLLLERLAPADPERGTGVRRVAVEVYRATIDGAHMEELDPRDDCAGVLLIAWQALRQVVRGLPLADLLARDDVTLHLRPNIALPPEALVYLTAEYGERALLRVAAKYGVRALGKELDDGTGL